MPVRVWPRAPLQMKNIQIISDTNQKSLKIKTQLLNKFKKNKIIRPNTVIVIGGDGFMLQILRKIRIQKRFFME